MFEGAGRAEELKRENDRLKKELQDVGTSLQKVKMIKNVFLIASEFASEINNKCNLFVRIQRRDNHSNR